MNKKLFAVFFLFLAFSSFGQEREAIIYFNDSTSIEGFGEIKKGKIHFRVTKEEEVSEWGHDMVRSLVFSAYGFSEKYEYIKPADDKDPVIMEVLEEGSLSLYKRFKYGVQMGVGAGISTASPLTILPIARPGYETLYYVKRKNEPFATDLEFSFKSRALRYFADCPALQEKIKARKLKAKDIEKVVYFYNDYCGDEWED